MCYPTFVCWYYKDEHKIQTQRLSAMCINLQIPFVGRELDFENKCKDLSYVKEALSPRRLIFKAGILYLRELYKELNVDIFYVHSDNIVLSKPPSSVFDGMDVGYCVGDRGDGIKVILSHGIYLKRNSKVAMDFLDLLCFKCKHIRAERPTEHDLIRTTVFELTGIMNDDKLIPNASKIKVNNKFNLAKNIKMLCSQNNKYIISKKGDTYIQW